MSDRFDDRIRELYSELTDAAPDLPPLPAPEPRRRLVRPLLTGVAATAVAVLVVATGIGLVGSLGDGADDAAAPAAQDPAATNAPSPQPPATRAPDDSSPTSVAAEEPGAADGPGTPRPADRILLLAALNRSCVETSTMFEAELPALENQNDYQNGFSIIFDRLEALRVIVEDANPNLADDELLAVADEIMAAQGSVILGGDEPRTGGYPVDVIETLAAFLADFGAVECSDLEQALP